MTMYTEEIRQGAAATRRTAHKNIMQVLIDVKDANPDAKPSVLFTEWWTIVKEDEDLLEATAQHTFTNLLSAMTGPQRRNKARPRSRQERKDAVAAIVKQAKTVLGLLMPNGQELGDCTFGYLRTLGGNATRLGDKGKPSERVRDVLSEEQARKLWKA